MKMNLKPAFKYQFKSYLKGSAIVYLILLLLALVSTIVSFSFSSSSSSFSMSFTGFSLTITIFMFVMGIVTIRNDMRLCLQFGVSRRTAFMSELLTVLATSAILAVAGEVLTGIAQPIIADRTNLTVADFYQMIYVGVDAATLSLGQHALSALVNISLMVSACLGGMFFSLMFWRLNKAWTIIVAVLIPLSINFVPIALYRLGIDFQPFFHWLASSPFNLILFALLLSVVYGVINWLLLRKANIREAKQ